MRKEILNEKICSNCRYFLQHYFKSDTKYKKAFCGHCMNENNRSRKKNNPIEVCELWEDIAIRQEERKNRIEEVLRNMSQSLAEIALIFKGDEDENRCEF